MKKRVGYIPRLKTGGYEIVAIEETKSGARDIMRYAGRLRKIDKIVPVYVEIQEGKQ